jgi:hypothetical protein
VNKTTGWLCEYAVHPGNAHVTWINGWPTIWGVAGDKPVTALALNALDPLRDAPEDLRTGLS